MEIVCEDCEEKIDRRHHTLHLERQCKFRSYVCEHCGYEDTYDAIAGSGQKRKKRDNTSTIFDICVGLVGTPMPIVFLQLATGAGIYSDYGAPFSKLELKNHFEECSNYPLECPNQCGKTDIKRKDMGTHRDSCKLEPLNCPFKYVGCTDKIHRQDMADHQQKNMEKHLLMLARDHERLSRKVEKLTASKKKK